MKKIKIFCLILLHPVLTGAQTAIKDQPGNNYYDQVKTWCMGHMPSQKDLLLMKLMIAQPIGFMDSLKRYDWVELGSYGYHEKTYTNWFDTSAFINETESQYQFRLFRILDDGVRVNFSLQKFKEETARMTTTSFTKAGCEIYQKLKTTAVAIFIQSSIYGELSYLRIVSFKKGILVIDSSKTGKTTDLKPMYRSVYMAIPKKFAFDF